IGALIVIERLEGLKNFVDNGIKLDAAVSYDLLLNIFNPHTPLHDGAVIVQGDRAAAASCYLPLTRTAELSKEYRTRHRAALGILLWLFVTVERREERPSEKVVDATVTYNPPPGMIILDPQERIRVRLRGSEKAIRRVNPFQIDVQVVVSATREGPVEVQLQP